MRLGETGVGDANEDPKRVRPSRIRRTGLCAKFSPRIGRMPFLDARQIPCCSQVTRSVLRFLLVSASLQIRNV